MTELGCSSSSARGFRASLPAFSVSIYERMSAESPKTSIIYYTFNSRSAVFSEGVMSASSDAMPEPVSSISVVSVPLDEGAMGEGSGTSLGLDATGEVWVGG